MSVLLDMRRSGVSAVGAVAVFAALALAPQASATTRPLPAQQQADLELRSVKTLHRAAPAHMFRTNDQLDFAIRVRNDGPRATRAAGTLRVFDPATGTAFHRVRFTTPRIRPGGVRVAQVIVLSRYMIGIDRYRTRACVASVRDRNVRNNCRSGPRFTVIPRSWTGRVEARAPFDPFEGTAVETSVAEVTFVFDDVRDAGFFYTGGGPVTYSASGSYGGCTYGGGATLNIDAAQTSLQLRPDLGSYYATGAELNEHYGITVDCGILGPRPPEQGPKNPAWWTAPLKPWGQDKRTISDSNTDILGRNWKWNLGAG
jgi:hypothetical protein